MSQDFLECGDLQDRGDALEIHLKDANQKQLFTETYLKSGVKIRS